MPNTRYIISFIIALSIFAAIPYAHASEPDDNLSLGYKAYQEGSFEKAIEYLEAAKKDDTLLSDYVLYYLGEAYLALHRTDEAFNTFTACVSYNAKGPLAPSAAEKTGDIYLAKGDAASAINAYKVVLTGYSDNLQIPDRDIRGQAPRLLYKLASALLLGNKYDEALPFIKRLLTEFPQTEYNDDSFASQILSGEAVKLNMDEFAARAKGLLKARNYEKTIKEIKAYLSEAPPWFPYETPLKHDDKLNLIMGQTFYQARNYKKAGEIFQELSSTADDDKIRQESLIWLARNYIRQKDMKSAGNTLRAFTSLYADRNLRDEAIYRLAMIAKDEGDANLAAAFLEQLIAESPASSYKDNALWQAGWMRYAQGDLEKSLEILKKIELAHKSLENSSMRMRALYWQGKISLMLGKKDNAVRLFKTAADRFPGAYYSAMSKKELERISGYELLDVSFKVSNPQPHSEPVESAILNIKSDESLAAQRARRLLKLGLNNLALKELASMDYRQDPINIILLYKQAGDIYHSYILARRLLYNSPDFSYRLAYPEAYQELVEKAAGEFSLDPFLIYAVMMQESEFDARSVSSAGAIGLLQIMPGTGEMIAKKMSYQSFRGDGLFEPDVNINFGSWYLKMLITKFNGKLPLAVAAYNAGPNAVGEWLKKWGESDMDEFVENIPYQETRKYVEKVLGYYAAYKTIYAYDSEANLGSRIAENEE